MLGSGLPSYREVLPGAYLVELPLPYSLTPINVYLVRLSEGYLLVDCGMDTEDCRNALLNALRDLSASWRDIRRILLTHVHPDHMGLAPRLVELTGARLLMHKDDVDYLNVLAKYDEYSAWSADVLREAGVSPDIIARIGAAAEGIHVSFQKLSPDVMLSGGEKIEASIGTLDVHWTPGHSPGHVCLYNAEHRGLFSGDQMLTEITPNIGWHPGREALSEYLNSLEDLARLEIDLVLPAHGAPFSNHREWIRKTVAHHADRCARILAELAAEPKTAADLVPRLWDRTLAPFHYRFAVFEILAHLEYLERQGKISRLTNGSVRWRSSIRT
jgi:glyoxylase-like metal-dependent hydrolase (beta-lactamase superfamily II)